MSDSQVPAPEPTLADVMKKLNEVAARVQRIEADLKSLIGAMSRQSGYQQPRR